MKMAAGNLAEYVDIGDTERICCTGCFKECIGDFDAVAVVVVVVVGIGDDVSALMLILFNLRIFVVSVFECVGECVALSRDADDADDVVVAADDDDFCCIDKFDGGDFDIRILPNVFNISSALLLVVALDVLTSELTLDDRSVR